ncbi:hypothetical protein IMG5_143730 [Ichthyophthirius multifiliis]|uniref:NmrA-like domain-containing protein n=1 Tax=Ichthyophthirius multifiliis TaxID=5932 RepID=G0QXK7_ICHMU|nr:hypothetical protein IMG5_143730 [Ichthyophthirius multifiliis]EGR30037.1 hypothetical protein IMG5_143730 [Ichthyophthirius multifiliis]|eukprot:XP_004031273.1 hypothetical protein IMG5_143730 [Ichthyophthirius multifiliis]
MSLLLISGANKIAQGLIRNLYNSGKYEQIVCADIFPTYYYLQRYLTFKDSLDQNSKTVLKEVKLIDKIDLESSIRQASHVIYFTHDYYLNVLCKHNLFKNTATLCKAAGVKKLLSVNPIENEHYGEQDPIHTANQTENEVKNINPNVIELKVDLTFGKHSNVVNQILTKIVNKQSLHFQPSNHSVQPIHTDNVYQAIQNLLESDNLKGNKFVARGSENLDWKTIVDQLSLAIGSQAQLNQNSLENVVSPASANYLSEFLYQPEYQNLVRFISQYVEPRATNHHEISDLGINNLTKFSEFYKPGSVQSRDYQQLSALAQYALHF